MARLGPRLAPVWWTMGDYGGGHGTPARFFYLAVNGASPQISDTDIKSFFRTGVNTSSDYVFVFVDISSDHRLRDDLLELKGGDEVYARLLKNSAFLISKTRMADINDIKDIEVIELRDYDSDMDRIYKMMGIHSKSTRMAFIRFLRRINRYAHLKPNLLGLGANLNEIISDMIDYMESKTP
jgi:hypothetical protein